MTTQWQLSGNYFEACSCKGACPCLYLGAPTEGDCSALIGWHIDHGRFEAVSLDGLNLAMALHAPGTMSEGGWKVVVYVDDTADQAQADALLAIFGGQAGGHPAMLASFVGEMLGVQRVPLRFESQGRHRRLRVGDIAEASVEGIEGQSGGDVRITGHPFAVAPGQELVVAQSERFRHQGHGLDWDLTERTAFYSPFNYQAG